MSKWARLTSWSIGLASGAVIGWFLLPLPRVRLADTLPKIVPVVMAENTGIEADARGLAGEISKLMDPVTGAVTLDAWRRIETMTLAELRDFIRALDSHPPLDEGERRVLELACERWATIESDRFLQWLERNSRFASDQSFRDRMFQFGLHHLADVDPELAVRVVCGLSEPGRMKQALRAIAAQLAAQRPDLLLELPERSKLKGPQLRQLQWRVVQALAAVDPQAAADYCAKSARHAAEALIEVWVAKDPVAAIAWMEANKTGAREEWTWRDTALGILARTDPAAGLAFLESLPGYEKVRAMANFAERWAEVDSAAAVEWALAQQNPVARGAALLELSRSLAEDDPKLAEALVDAMPNATVRENAFAGYAERRVLNMRAPEPHIEWAESQQDPKRRAVALGAVVGAWAEDAPERAADYAFAADDPAERDTLATVVAEHGQIDGPASQQLDRLQSWSSGLAPVDRELAVKKALEVHGSQIPAPVRKALENGVPVETAIEMTRKIVSLQE
ncbi:MAG: hypothetical protein ACI9R3_002166 [Verrucomicrobiales bacterium]|jgi:hypothetical protein